MSESAESPTEPAPEATEPKCGEGEHWDPETEECVSNVQGLEETEPEAGGVVQKGGLMDSIIKTIREYNTELYKKLRAEQKKDIDRLRKELTGEAEIALRKSFGLNTNPVVHKSDLAAFARTLQLETSPTGKRSPASPGKMGPEGNKDLLKSKTTKTLDAQFLEYFPKEAKA